MLSANEKRILKNYRGIGENGDATAGLPPRQFLKKYHFFDQMTKGKAPFPAFVGNTRNPVGFI